MKRLKLSNLMMLVAVGLGGMGMTRGAEGVLIRHTFSGTINHVVAGPPPAPWEGAGIDSIWELSYIFDTTLPDQNPTNEVGRYFIDNGSISMDGVELFAVSGEITVKDGLLGVDQYQVSLAGLSLGGGGISLTAAPGTLASDAIPIDLNLAEFVDRIFQFGGGGAGFNFVLQGTVNSFISEVVPTPGAFLLFVLSSCFSVRSRRRSVRH